jgi:hypothetical protein
MALALSIEDFKRPGYTIGSQDVLANFKRAGERADITTEQAWVVLFQKHIDAIISIMAKPDLPRAEAAPGRFADAINYLRLGFALLRERESAASTSPVVDAVSPAPLSPEVPTSPTGTASEAPAFTTTLPSAEIAVTEVGPCQFVFSGAVK